MDNQILFTATDKNGNVEEITDLYWFEEAGLHSFDDSEYYKIKASTDCLVALMQLLTNDERMDVIRCFCKHCGSNNPQCQCRNDE